MESALENFIKRIIEIFSQEPEELFSIKKQQEIISNINKFLYTNYSGIGTTLILDSNREYFSEFHKYWEKYHKKILNPHINDKKAEKIADVLHSLYIKYGEGLFRNLYDTFDLDKQEISLIRFFTANQDFRGSRNFEDFAKIYIEDPSIFDINSIAERPEEFLKNLKLGNLSQTDKRLNYARNAANFIIENDLSSPFELFNFFNNDYIEIRDALISKVGMGFGAKKADMFLRDMYILGVWESGRNFNKIDVASDVNTIKVALRTGLLETDILLLSSFLDIFCYQYSLMDEMTAKSWRRVWEIWHDKFPDESIESPCLMDYLIYRIIGKEFCKESLFKYRCEVEYHDFFWHSGRNKTCQICYKKYKKRVKALRLFRDLPCKYKEGYISIKKNRKINEVLKNINECPFSIICNPKSPEFKKLRPPKSISIIGRTGWESARTRDDEGGGGLMS